MLGSSSLNLLLIAAERKDVNYPDKRGPSCYRIRNQNLHVDRSDIEWWKSGVVHPHPSHLEESEERLSEACLSLRDFCFV